MGDLHPFVNSDRKRAIAIVRQTVATANSNTRNLDFLSTLISKAARAGQYEGSGLRSDLTKGCKHYVYISMGLGVARPNCYQLSNPNCHTLPFGIHRFSLLLASRWSEFIETSTVWIIEKMSNG